jgi:hypothetical protein
MPGISGLSWFICLLSIAIAIAASWGADPQSVVGKVHLPASALAIVVAVLVLVNGARTGRRIAAFERGRYPRIKPEAACLAWLKWQCINGPWVY